MEYSQSILTELYTWCFEEAPDTITSNVASLTGNPNFVSIYQSQVPDSSMVWCVSASSETTTITAFETDLSTSIDNFKSAWATQNT
jgi:hypothetical protein